MRRPSQGPPRRQRSSRKARTVVEPAPATWVQVAPGKFVRVEPGGDPAGPGPHRTPARPRGAEPGAARGAGRGRPPPRRARSAPADSGPQDAPTEDAIEPPHPDRPQPDGLRRPSRATLSTPTRARPATTPPRRPLVPDPDAATDRGPVPISLDGAGLADVFTSPGHQPGAVEAIAQADDPEADLAPGDAGPFGAVGEAEPGPADAPESLATDGRDFAEGHRPDATPGLDAEGRTGHDRLRAAARDDSTAGPAEPVVVLGIDPAAIGGADAPGLAPEAHAPRSVAASVGLGTTTAADEALADSGAGPEDRPGGAPRRRAHAARGTSRPPPWRRSGPVAAHRPRGSPSARPDPPVAGKALADALGRGDAVASSGPSPPAPPLGSSRSA